MEELSEKEKQMMEELKEKMKGIMRTLIDEKHFQFPIRFAVFDSLESFFAGKFESIDGRNASNMVFYVDHSPKGVIASPTNVLFVDALNQALAFKIELGEKQPSS